MKKLSFVAKELGITKMTLWNWKNKGLVEFHKIGNMNYIDDECFFKLKGIENKGLMDLYNLESDELADYRRGEVVRPGAYLVQASSMKRQVIQ